jgi:hypothetical protein
VGKPGGKRPLGRTKRRWENNFKMDHREIWWGDMDCIDLSHDRDRWRTLVNTVMNLRIPQNVGKFLSTQEFPQNIGKFLSSQEGLTSMEFTSRVPSTMVTRVHRRQLRT